MRNSHIQPEENRFAASLREFRSPRAVTFCGVMCALAVVLSALTTISLGPYVKIGLSGLPNQAVDYLFGPAAGAIFSAALEVLKFLLRPSGVYFPGFTLSAALSGAIYGFMLYRRPPTLARSLAAHLLVKIFVNIGCNTLWLAVLYQKAAWAIFPARVAANLSRLPCDVLVTYAILRILERSILPIFRRASLSGHVRPAPAEPPSPGAAEQAQDSAAARKTKSGAGMNPSAGSS